MNRSWSEFFELCAAYDTVFTNMLKKYYRNCPRLMAPGKTPLDYSKFKLTKKDAEKIAFIRAFLAENKKHCEYAMENRGYVFQLYIKWHGIFENLSPRGIELYLQMLEGKRNYKLQ